MKRVALVLLLAGCSRAEPCVNTEVARMTAPDGRHDAVLFERADFKRGAATFHEESFWMLGPAGASAFDRLPPAAAPTSRAFALIVAVRSLPASRSRRS